VKGDSAAPCKNRKATNFVSDQTKHKKKVSQQKQVQQKPKESVWGTMNKYAYEPKAQPLDKVLTSCFVLRSNSSGKVVSIMLDRKPMFIRILLFGFLSFL
jgi:hypothetical protein